MALDIIIWFAEGLGKKIGLFQLERKTVKVVENCWNQRFLCFNRLV